ncbi:MAG: citrate/2-methylcitrate synthase [Oscillospiraceae bacterium]|jgi:citrate synthase|nr:citrate/2-methylcitrate synthase [Oscillospiraceae bacterium]
MDLEKKLEAYCQLCLRNNVIAPALYAQYGVKRGLRDENAQGVLTGLTNISKIIASKTIDGVKHPCEGKLYYRGYDVEELIADAVEENRCAFEEVSYLLLFGDLPTQAQLEEFKAILADKRDLPTNFTRDVIMKGPSKDIMNSLSKSVLTLASYDPNAQDISLPNVLNQCMKLISVFPMLAVYGYSAYNHYERNKSFFIHKPDPKLSLAENILRMLRPDKKYTALEAQVLDIALILHMEHGGGNNSTFTTRVVTSAGSDTYSVVAAALSSLKGPRHGGANIKVVEMMEHIESVLDSNDEDALRRYLGEILDGNAFDGAGLIYGMGHAIYSKSDPRAKVFKGFVQRLALEKGEDKRYALYSAVERIAPEVISAKRRMYKGVSANVDFYSGLVYSMLGIPPEMFTPLFAIARIVGWSAHRIEELSNPSKIMRPAYMSLSENRNRRPLATRE